ncbi:MAG: co-chaperone GroES [Cetobacterium sp.]|uniref:Co-chaperonin GroES n=1 Tax=Cetobacterium ceti TaxID=180163 RepID=A0A1T4JUJ2_9FUSO|nr:co-chaperone GroES [Cetobacterium ceti]MCJ8342549.1 co-chaperone GroES [Cetobacterium sp.]SJZ33892.1 chaperonin GroES [Cetobacterium ceti]
MIRPIGERVLIKIAEMEKKTVSGIILAGNDIKENSNIGEIIAMGSIENSYAIKIGDKILYKKNVGTEIEENNIKYLVLEIEDILAVIE